MVRLSHRQRVIEEAYDVLADAMVRSMGNSDTEMGGSDERDSSSESTSSSSSSESDSDLLSEATDSSGSGDEGGMVMAAARRVVQLEMTRFLRAPVRGPPRRPLIEEIEYWQGVGQYDRFRGYVRMTPPAFDELVRLLEDTAAFANISDSRVAKQLAVALYRLGRSGNGAGERDVAAMCGCSVGSVIDWTHRCVAGLIELRGAVVAWASEQERADAADWVAKRSGVEEWKRGWCLMDGTQIPLAWRPARHHVEYYKERKNERTVWCILLVADALTISSREGNIQHQCLPHRPATYVAGH